MKNSPAIFIHCTSLAYGGPSLPVSAVRLPASSNIVSTPLALSIALLASRQPLCQELAEVPSPHPGEGPDDYIRSDLSATPPTRKRPVQISTVSSSIISLHGKCAPEDNDGVLELRRVDGLNPSTRMPYIRNTHRRPDQIQPTGKFFNYPRLIANDSISVGCAMSTTTDSRWLPFLAIKSSHTYGARHTSYRSTMVVTTQAERHVYHTDLFK